MPGLNRTSQVCQPLGGQGGGGGVDLAWFQLYPDVCVKCEGHGSFFLLRVSELSEMMSLKMGVV